VSISLGVCRPSSSPQKTSPGPPLHLGQSHYHVGAPGSTNLARLGPSQSLQCSLRYSRFRRQSNELQDDNLTARGIDIAGRVYHVRAIALHTAKSMWGRRYDLGETLLRPSKRYVVALDSWSTVLALEPRRGRWCTLVRFACSKLSSSLAHHHPARRRATATCISGWRRLQRDWVQPRGTLAAGPDVHQYRTTAHVQAGKLSIA
jgi:hypothetical protein